MKVIYTIWKSIYRNFGPLVESVPTPYRSDRWPNVLSRILVAIQSLPTSDVIGLSSNEHIWSIWGNYRHTIMQKSSENIIMINVTSFCGWIMSNWVSLHEETDFRVDRYDSFVCIISFCDWSASSDLSSIPSRSICVNHICGQHDDLALRNIRSRKTWHSL